MLVSLDQFFTYWLGSASAIGASSWLQALTWVATLVAAFIAGLALRRSSLQNRATLLLNLYKTWDELGATRKEFAGFFESTRLSITQTHSGLQEAHQIQHMRNSFAHQLNALKAASDPQFSQFSTYVSFFEVLGMYVKNGYIPLRDAMQIYKGPILAVDIVWRDYIAIWEKEAHVPSGLLEHAIFLMDSTRTRTGRPIFYWLIYRPCQILSKIIPWAA